MTLTRTGWISAAVSTVVLAAGAIAQHYCWLHDRTVESTIEDRITPPAGFERVRGDSSSFAGWLRGLPLKDEGAEVHQYDGRLKTFEDAHHAVIDMDVGTRDLQQCADVVIRLRAEYFLSHRMYDSIAFNFTNGDRAALSDWMAGMRPIVNGNDVRWVKSGAVDSSYASFREYLDIVFTYAGTYSLSREMRPRSGTCDIEPGDVFVQGGFPGHAVMVVDVAVNNDSGRKLFLLAQGFTPAQEAHILRNPGDESLSPWYDCDFGDTLQTPQWTFRAKDLRRF